MNKVIVSLLAIALLNGSCFAMEDKPKGSYYSLAKYAEKTRALETVAQKYREFLNQMGQKNPGDIIPTMKAIFAPNIKKIVNGDSALEKETIQGLYDQITEAKNGENGVGTWSVREANFPIANLEKNAVAAHFEILTEKKGTIVVMKWLICDDKGFIKEINEVFNFKRK